MKTPLNVTMTIDHRKLLQLLTALGNETQAHIVCTGLVDQGHQLLKRMRAAKTADKKAEEITLLIDALARCEDSGFPFRVETWTFSVDIPIDDIPDEEEDDREPPEPDYDMQLEDQWLRQQDERSDPHHDNGN